MGEITEALRRAREEAKRGTAPRRAADTRSDAAPPTGVPGAASTAPPLRPGQDEIAGGGDAGVHIPDLKKGAWAGRALLADPRGSFAVHYRQFAIRVGRELEQRGAHAVLITSAVNQDGKTTTACNLALAMASMAAGRRIALVELDLRRPQIARALGLARPKTGFERVLRGETPLEAALLRSDAGVDLFLVAEPVDKAHEILARPECAAAIQALVRSYDQVVFDAPPVLAVPDVSLVLPHVGACITVARAGATPLSAFRAMAEALPPEQIVGAFVNNARSHGGYPRQSYYYDSPEDSRGE